jgi:sec-independent protein translocase protein TatA
MPSLGAPELVLILVIVVIVFGVGRLPEVGGALGKGIREFRRASAGLEEDRGSATPGTSETTQKSSDA